MGLHTTAMKRSNAQHLQLCVTATHTVNCCGVEHGMHMLTSHQMVVMMCRSH